jgi:RNA polymerase sigma factor (sigma-70 family)
MGSSGSRHERHATERDQALERAYVTHAAALRRIAGNVLGNDASAEDVVHDVFAALCTGNSLLRIQDVYRYLVSAVRRQAVRMRARSRRWEPVDADRLAFLLNYAHLDPPRDAHAELHELLDHYARRLSRHRRAILRRWLLGCTPSEIAQTRNCSVNTVKAQLSRAKHKLADAVAAEREREREKKERARPDAPRDGDYPHGPWHFLNFFPLPHGHGSFRPTLL